MRQKHKIIIALLVLGAIAIAAESGWYSLKSLGSGGASMGIHYKEIDLQSITAYSFTETSSGYRLYVSENSTETHVLDVFIEIENLEIGGRYWTPLYKTLTASYSGKALITPDLMEITYQGRLEDITITGLCSPYAARRAVSQMVREAIRKNLETHFSSQKAPYTVVDADTPIASPLVQSGPG